MSEATDALIDIKEAIEEFGSTIRISTETETGYDPFEGATFTTTFEDTKGFTNTEATPKVFESFSAMTSNSAYDLSVLTFSDTPITKDNKIVFRGNSYEILFVSETILQDLTLLYELLVRK